MRRVISVFLSMLIMLSVVSSLTVNASAGLFDVTKSGEMVDTSADDNGSIFWKLTYNTFSGEAKLVISGNGYMPNTAEDSWLTSLYLSGCYLTELVIEEGVRSIMSQAFYGETELKSVTLPKSLEFIGESAFKNTAITEVTLPEKLEYFDGTIFDTPTLINYKVDKNNPFYKSVDGVVYSKDGSELVAYPCGRFVSEKDHKPSIPKTVNSIGRYAFLNSKAKSITIPGHVKSVGMQAFAGNSNLKELNIENGVEAFYDGAFLACSSLKEIHLPRSVNYVGYCAFAHIYKVDYETIEFFLDSAGVAHDGVNEENVAYYLSLEPLSQYTIDSFVICVVDESAKIYAPENSAGHKYAKMFEVGYVKSEALTPKLISATNVNGGVKVKWSLSGDAKGYYLYRKNKDGKWERIKEISDKNTVSYVDKKPLVKATNTYTVRAVSKSGLSSYYKKGVSTHYLATPKLVSAKPTTSGINVTWEAVKGAENYNIYRKQPADTTWEYIAQVKGSKTNYSDKDVKNSVKYCYTVRACDSEGISSFDSQGVRKTFVQAPKITSVSNTQSGVKIKWQEVKKAETYRVYRKTSGGSWKKLADVDSGVLSFTDKTVKSSVKYEYTVKAFNGKAWSSYYKDNDIVHLSTPSSITLKSTKNGVTVKFGQVNGAEKYRVYRKTVDGSWEKLADVKANSFTDKTAKKGTTYYYTVKAFNGSYKSDYLKNGVKIKDIY